MKNLVGKETKPLSGIFDPIHLQECTIDLIGPKKLSQKYKTAPHFITRIVRKAGFSITPDHLGKYPDIPKKSDDMSDEEYQKVMKKYWNDQRKKQAKKMKKEKKERKKMQHEKENVDKNSSGNQGYIIYEIGFLSNHT